MFFYHLSDSNRHFAILATMDISGSLSKNQIQALRLLRKRSERYAQGRFVVEGERTVMQVLQNRVLDVLFLVVSAEYLEELKNSGTDTADEMERDQTGGTEDNQGSGSRSESPPTVDLTGFGPVYHVSARIFGQISDTDNAQGILAVCRLPDPQTTDALLDRTGIIFATDRIRDPGNLGTMIRTATWFGLTGLVFSAGTTDLFHPKVVRSTAGATGVLPWLATELQPFLEEAAARGWKVNLLESGPGSKSYLTVPPSGRDILVVGNEAMGLSGEIRSSQFQRLRIDPAQGSGDAGFIESLNASVASAIVMARFSSATGSSPAPFS